jgi:hypothetical protein
VFLQNIVPADPHTRLEGRTVDARPCSCLPQGPPCALHLEEDHPPLVDLNTWGILSCPPHNEGWVLYDSMALEEGGNV